MVCQRGRCPASAVDRYGGAPGRRGAEHEPHEWVLDEQLLLGGVEGLMLAITSQIDLLPQSRRVCIDALAIGRPE